MEIEAVDSFDCVVIWDHIIPIATVEDYLVFNLTQTGE